MTVLPFARAIDVALEATIVGGFSKAGIAARRRLECWQEPARLDGQVVVVTGATSGLGLATAERCARLGATVCIVGRDPAKLDRAATSLAAVTSGEIDVERCDLSDLCSAHALAASIGRRYRRLDALVHNAGALVRARELSPQGVEVTVATHLLSPFVLTETLLPLLGATGRARVVTVTSGGMYTERFDLEALEMAPGDYDGVVAYARAKRAQVVLTAEWQRRSGHREIRFDAVHPGWADTPGIRESLPRFSALLGPLLRSPAEGADTIAWLAAGAAPPGTGGQLWHDRHRRSQYYLPWTRPVGVEGRTAGPALWAWCAERTGTG